MSVVIQDGSIILTVKGLEEAKVYEYKMFYKFIHHVLSLIEG